MSTTNAQFIHDLPDNCRHRYDLTEPDYSMKARRGHIDVKDHHKEVEECKRHKSNQDELPPVFMAIWTLHTTKIVREYKWTIALFTVTTQ